MNVDPEAVSRLTVDQPGRMCASGFRSAGGREYRRSGRGAGLAGYANKPAEPVGTCGENDVEPRQEPLTRGTVGEEELAVARQRFDAAPGVSAGYPWAELPSGFMRLRSPVNRLCQDRFHPKDGGARLAAVLGGRVLHLRHLTGFETA